MQTLPQTMSMGDRLIDRDLPASNDDDERRTAIAAKVLDYQVFNAYDDMTERQQRAFIEALRVDNAANDATIVRIMRAAFERVVQMEIDDHDCRIAEEVAMLAREVH